jgi:carbon storage regulator CsrA
LSFALREIGSDQRNFPLAKKESMMLVISRRENEGILIGDGIRLVVLEVKTGRVRVGIDAGAETEILREELAETEDRHSPEERV